jgi:hypothetical protein
VTSLYENYDTLEDNACDWPISTVSQPYVLRGLAQAASIPLDHPRQEERGSNAPDLAVPYVDNFDPFATHPRACQGYWARIHIRRPLQCAYREWPHRPLSGPGSAGSKPHLPPRSATFIPLAFLLLSSECPPARASILGLS